MLHLLKRLPPRTGNPCGSVRNVSAPDADRFRNPWNASVTKAEPKRDWNCGGFGYRVRGCGHRRTRRPSPHPPCSGLRPETPMRRAAACCLSRNTDCGEEDPTGVPVLRIPGASCGNAVWYRPEYAGAPRGEAIKDDLARHIDRRSGRRPPDEGVAFMSQRTRRAPCGCEHRPNG